MKARIFNSLTAATLLLGCGPIQNAIDCNDICSRYRTCFDSTYDTNVCAARCRDNANSDPKYMNKTDSCHICFWGKDCSSAAVNCATQCAEIVP
jgi:hypothetical protein